MAEIIQKIQFKRGQRTVLESRLTSSALGVLDKGEPAFEIDTGQLKIGDGISDYINLPYVGDNEKESKFVIHDPVDNQVLLYDSSIDKWVNKDLADSKSIIYLNSRGLTIKGYDTATQGQLLVKDNTLGLAWIDNPIPGVMPIIDEKVQKAENAANEAATQAVNSGNSAIAAHRSEIAAQTINEQTIEYIENKFWWGTLAEYNALTEINEGTFYFIKPGV